MQDSLPSLIIFQDMRWFLSSSQDGQLGRASLDFYAPDFCRAAFFAEIIVCKLKVGSHAKSSKFISAIFPTAGAHFLSP